MHDSVLKILLPLLLLSQQACKSDSIPIVVEIQLKVSSSEFYEGCTLPISIHLINADNETGELMLFFDNRDLGKVKASPDVYYLETEAYPPGDYQLRASYTPMGLDAVIHEITITLLPLCADCPEALTDIDGNRYGVVQIGNQCWMAENLRVIHFPDGSALNNGNSSMGDSLFSPTFTAHPDAFLGWYFAYNGDSKYTELYGYLYTWATVINGIDTLRNSEGFFQGIAPDGWHIPEMEEWRTLIDYLGGSNLAGYKLKDPGSSLWRTSLPDTSRVSGFSALPGGCCLFNGSYIEEGQSSYFWTATPSIVNHAWHVLLSHHDSKANLLGHQDSKRFGYSVRCLMN